MENPIDGTDRRIFYNKCDQNVSWSRGDPLEICFTRRIDVLCTFPSESVNCLHLNLKVKLLEEPFI